jgi:hypothetical protein
VSPIHRAQGGVRVRIRVKARVKVSRIAVKTLPLATTQEDQQDKKKLN